MKIDSPVVGRIGAPNTIAQYTQGNAPRGGEAVAAGLNNLGQGIGQLANAFQQQDDSLNRFNSLRGFSDFQGKVTTSLAEAKRTYASDGQGFTKAASDLYDKSAEEYIATVPPQLQPEFRYRIGETKRAVIADSLDFQYKQGDAWFNQGVKDELDKSKNILDKQPDALDSQRDHIFQTIDATNLPQAQKDALKHDASISLESVGYRANVRGNAVTDAVVGPIGSAVQKIMGAEGSGPQSWGGSKAAGYGQFIPSTWIRTVRQYRPDLVKTDDQGHVTNTDELLAMRNDKALGTEMTTHLTQESANILQNRGLPPTDGNLYLMHFLGSGDAPKVLSADPSTPLKGLVQDASITANPFLNGMTAGDVRSWAAQKMGGRSSIDEDPKYANIPLEDRWALQKDGEAQAAGITADAAATRKQFVDTQTNSLYVGLMDHSMGQTDIDNLRKSGVLSTYEQINKAQSILTEANKGLNDANAGNAAYANPTTAWSQGNPDQAKQLNAVVKQEGGVEKISNMDGDYIGSSVIPRMTQTGIIPSDVGDALSGMVTQGNQERMMWALDTLSQMQSANGRAYNNRIPDDVRQTVDRWNMLKDTIPDQNALFQTLRDGPDQATRQVRGQLRKEAQGILGQSTGGVVNATSLLAGAMGGFQSGSSFFNASKPAAPAAQQALQNEFNARFVENYSIVGDETKASAMAVQQMSRDWQQTQLGVPDLMKFAPEKYYDKVNDSYDWINRDVLTKVNNFQFRAAPDLSPQEQNLLQYSRDNMNTRQIMKDADGNVTSVMITGVTGPDGRIYNVPGFADGKLLNEEQAQANAAAQGWDKFPGYATGKEADAAADHVHRYIEEDNAYFVAHEGAPRITKYQLMSDAQTEAEVKAHNAGARPGQPAPPMPSYQVFVFDENNVARPWTTVNGDPLRTSFKPKQEELDEQDANYHAREQKAAVDETIYNYERMKSTQENYSRRGMPVPGIPQEDTDAYNKALARKKAQKADPSNPLNHYTNPDTLETTPWGAM